MTGERMANKVTTGKRAVKKPAAKTKASAVAASKKAAVAKPAARKEKPAEEVVDKRKVAAAKAVAAAAAAKAPAIPLKGKPGRKPKAQNDELAVLAGAGDAVILPPEDLAARLPRARLERVPGDHLSAVAQPAFRAAIVAFLAAVDRGEAGAG